MSTRNFMATHNLIAVSANKAETAINKEQTLDTTMLCALGDVINLEPRRESNAEEATGKEEPDAVYDLGNVAAAPLNFEKAQPQHFAFLLAYALGSVSSGAAGSGYEHTITPIDGDLDGDRSNPSFTAGQRFGKTVLKRRFASMFVGSITAGFSKDEWCKISGETKGSGKVIDNVYEESITAAENATELTLAANAVEGSTAAERLSNVQRIRVELSTGVWTEVAYSAVSAATPAVITITAPAGSATTKTYKVLYIPTEVAPSNWAATTAYALGDLCKPTTPNDYWYICTVAGTSDATEPTWPTTIGGTVVDATATWECITDAWMTFPSKVTETPLRVSQLTLKVGGAWSGSAFAGGRTLSSEIKSIEWTFNNNQAVEFVPGASGAYATRGIREGRTQTITLNREFREYILQQHIDDNDTLGLYILAEGAVYDDPHKYQVEIIFPTVSVLKAPLSVDGKRMAEAGDLVVLEHDTYGSVIAKVKNLQSTYAA